LASDNVGFFPSSDTGIFVLTFEIESHMTFYLLISIPLLKQFVSYMGGMLITHQLRRTTMWFFWSPIFSWWTHRSVALCRGFWFLLSTWSIPNLINGRGREAGGRARMECHMKFHLFP
jgi:hypothetical protein